MAKKTPDRPAQRPVPKVAVAPASPDGPNRKVRKEEARRQREALQRKIARRKFIQWGVVVVVILLVAGIGTAIAMNAGSSKKKAATGPTPSPTLVGMQTGLPPWNSGQDGLLERDRAIGIPFAATEQLVFHHHDLIQIFVNGHKVTIPLGIGIGTSGSQISFYTSLHTHDTSGVVHIESPVQRTFTLGNFFDVWGVTFSSKNIGGYEASGDKQIRVYLNGKPYTGDPRNLPLTQHDDVVVTYGTKAQLPHPIPVTYSATISSTCAPGC